MRKYIIPIISLLGIALTIGILIVQLRRPQAQKIISVLPTPPFEHYVAGEGQIEASGRTVTIGFPFSQIITQLFVVPGQAVRKNDPLLQLDTRQLDADLEKSLQELATAQTKYDEQTTLFNFYERLKEKSAVSQQEYQKAFFAKQTSNAELLVAQESVNQIKTMIERSTIIAPTDGMVLAVNTHTGETAQLSPSRGAPFILFGDTSVLNLRTYIPEEDAWRIIPGAPGFAYVRGNASIKIPLRFLYVEPFMIAKPALTGSDTERVDTRVLQIVYEFDANKYPVYVGQLLDIYLDAKPYHE
ncbi:glycosyl hydrolase family 18 [Candidatus Dependentiae bacterium Noda2021]|nr:glycosyl hydrolase family 18 [Candidatus Dependentiae bacterium Noda2021]